MIKSRILRALILPLALFAFAPQAEAQTGVPVSVPSQTGRPVANSTTTLNYPDPTTGNAHVVRPGDGLPVNCVSGCSGGGGGSGGSITNLPATVDTSTGASTSNTLRMAQSYATPVSTSALATNLVIKSSPGSLLSFQVAADSTLSSAAWYVLIYNLSTAPSDGAVTPAKCFPVSAGTTTIGGSYPNGGIRFATGIVIQVSTTGCFTQTSSTHAFISGDYQ